MRLQFLKGLENRNLKTAEGGGKNADNLNATPLSSAETTAPPTKSPLEG